MTQDDVFPNVAQFIVACHWIRCVNAEGIALQQESVDKYVTLLKIW